MKTPAILDRGLCYICKRLAMYSCYQEDIIIQMNQSSQSLPFYHIGRWVKKGSLSILDQAFFSGTNFVLSILLARWLASDLYGIFALSFAIYLFFSGIYNAIILEPISVFATSKYHEQFNQYLSSQFVIHFIVTGILGGFIICVAWILYYLNVWDSTMIKALFGVGVSLPFLLLLWLVRRIFYIIQSPSNALLSTFIYFVSALLGALVISSSVHRENIFLWYAMIGLASLLSSMPIFFSKKIKVISMQGFSNWKTFIREQWLFGRWIVLATLLYSLGTQTQIFLAASYLGLHAAGAFKAVQNVMLPMFQIVAAVSTLMLPPISLEYGRTNYEEMRSKSLRVAGLLVFVAICYEIALLFGAKHIDYFLYDAKYTEFAWLIPVIGLIPLLNALQTGFSLILRSLQKPIYYIIDKSISAFIGVSSAFLFISFWSVPGAVYSLLLVELTTLLIYWWLYRKWFAIYLRA
jgi:O-antigen/teichoic acid export membrane protein